MDLFQFFFVAYRQQGPCPVDPVIYQLNMDTQDAQDQQDETLLHGKLTRCVFPRPNPRGVAFEWVKNVVFLSGPSPSFVPLRGLLFFLLFQISRQAVLEEHVGPEVLQLQR